METVPVTIMPQEKQKKEYKRTCSNETFYMDYNEGFHSKCQSAANLLQKRRQLRPLLGTGVGNPYRAVSNYGVSFISVNSPTKFNMNGYSHRIMSAKLLQVKQLQNELTDAQFQLNELFTENRLLKTLQKRQDLALSKYEGTKAALPQLIRSHNEEVRFLRANLKHFKTQCREKDHQIKELDADLKSLKEQHHHLLKLSRDRHLGDREQLTKQVEELKEIIREQDVRIQTLNRKVMLETKNFKHELSTEMARHKETRRHLSEAMDRISKLEILVETKEKYIATLVPRRNFHNSNNRHSVLMMPLAGRARYADLHASMKSEAELIPQLEEESSEGTCMAPNTNSSYGSTHQSTDTVEINSENHLPSDGYIARRMKLEHKRKIMLDRKLHPIVMNQTDDLVTSSGLTSPTPSSSVINDDKDTDCVDDYASKQPYSFGAVYSSKKLTGNFSVDDHKTSKSEHLMKSYSDVSLKEESDDTNTDTKTSRRRSLQENSRKDVVTKLTSDIKKESRVRKGSCLSLELNPIESGLMETLSVNKSRKGSLVMEKINYVEEKLMSAITTNRSSSRRGSLVREKTNSAEEESMATVNRSSSRKGSLKKDKINFFDEESISALVNRSVSRKASVNNKINVNMESVKCVASDVADQVCVPSDEKTKSDAPSKYIFPETTECLSAVPQTVNKIQNTLVCERDVTEDKLKQSGNNADSEPLEIKGYEKNKLLAALKAIDDEEGSSVGNQEGKNSSVLESLLSNTIPNTDSSLNVSLPLMSYK